MDWDGYSIFFLCVRSRIQGHYKFYLTSDLILTGRVFLPKLKPSSIFPSMTATARKSPFRVGPWFIQIKSPFREVVLILTINLFLFSPRRLKKLKINYKGRRVKILAVYCRYRYFQKIIIAKESIWRIRALCRLG